MAQHQLGEGKVEAQQARFRCRGPWVKAHRDSYVLTSQPSEHFPATAEPQLTMIL